jgi:hypothetical protein
MQSPHLHPALLVELQNFDQKLPSRDAYLACCSLKDRCEPLDTPNLVVIESIRSPLRRMYVDYPSFAEWFGLERVGVVEGDNGSVFVMMDALH